MPSPALKVAKIFCREAIKFGEKNYQKFSFEEIKKTFKFANRKIKEFNKKKLKKKGKVLIIGMLIFIIAQLLLV